MTGPFRQPAEPVQIILLGLAMAGLGALFLAFLVWGNGDERKSTDTASTDQSAPAACAIDRDRVVALKARSKGTLAAFVAMEEPYSAAGFQFENRMGTTVALSDWQNSVLLVNLWATWCVPCRAEMPYLDALQAQRGSENFEVVAISVDKSDPAKPMAFFEEINIRSMAFHHDRGADTLARLKQDGLAIGLPATLLVDRRGCVLGRLNGPAEWHREEAYHLIRAAF